MLFSLVVSYGNISKTITHMGAVNLKKKQGQVYFGLRNHRNTCTVCDKILISLSEAIMYVCFIKLCAFQKRFTERLSQMDLF